MTEVLNNIENKIPVSKPREFILASSIPVSVILFYFLGGFGYWNTAYQSYPFRTIFGTGLVFIVIGFTMIGGRYLRKLFWIRRKRIRNIEKWEKSEKSSSRRNN